MYTICRVITVELSKDVEEFLNGQDYEKRSGDGSYTKNYINIVPKKKWYWLTGLGIIGSRTQLL